MRRLLATCGIALTLILGGGAFVPQVSAQGDQTLIDSGGAAEGAKTSVEGGGSGTTNPAAANTPKPGAGGASTDELGIGLGWLMTKLMSLFAMMLGIAALTLNYAVYYCVVTMGEVVNQLSAIGVTWRILRDIGNIALLFGFIATGVAVVLGVNWYGDRNKLIPKLLIAAVALNFSLFAAEAVIDVGNLFATQFYIQINGGQAPKPLTTSAVSDLMNEGISSKLMAQLGFQHIYGPALNNTSILKADGMLFVSFMSIMLFLITSLVFFMLAFILIQRFVVLIALIIVSPIGVAGYAIPKLEGLAGQWWDALVKQTITAPVLLLGLYVALAVITDAQFLVGFLGKGTTADWTGFVQGGSMAGFAGLFLSYLVAMGLMLGVAMLSKKLGAYGSERALKWGGALTLGATAWAARRTGGRALEYASQRARSAGWAQSRVGRYGVGLLDAGAKSSFDLRTTNALKSLPYGGLNAGAGVKGGFRDYEKKKFDEYEKYAKDLKPNKTQQTLIEAHEQELSTQKDQQDKAVARLRSAMQERARKIKDKNATPAEVAAAEQEVAAAEAAVASAKKSVKGAQDKLTDAKAAPQDRFAASISSGGTLSQFNKRKTKVAGKIKDAARKDKKKLDAEAIKKLLEDAEKKTGEEKKPPKEEATT